MLIIGNFYSQPLLSQYVMAETYPVTIKMQRTPLIPRFFLKGMFAGKSKEIPGEIVKRTTCYPVAKFSQSSNKKFNNIFSLDISSESVPWDVAMSTIEDDDVAYVMLSSLRYKVEQTNIFLSTALMTPAAQKLMYSTEGYTASDDGAISQGKIKLKFNDSDLEAAVFINPNSVEMKNQLVFIVKDLYISFGSNFSLIDMKILVENYLILE